MSLLRPTIDSGRLLRLFDERLPAEFAHYLVFPLRSRNHAGLAAFRDWVLDEAQRYAQSDDCPQASAVPPTPPRRQPRRVRSA
jgi:LysR family glycine cleavage system transcriptional activator